MKEDSCLFGIVTCSFNIDPTPISAVGLRLNTILVGILSRVAVKFNTSRDIKLSINFGVLCTVLEIFLLLLMPV